MNHSLKDKFFKILAGMFFLLVAGGWYHVYPEFLVEEEEAQGPEIIIEDKKEPVYPPYIALNISCERIPLAEDSIQITWDPSPSFSGDFVLGRSNEIIDTPEKALAAKTINTISTRNQQLVIDTGLAPGNYYYVVLAREKIVERKIELIKNMNYSTKPVTIVAREAGGVPQQVTGIRIQAAGQKGALISWKRIHGSGISYTVYRAQNPVSDTERLRSAVIRTMAIDLDSFIDENANQDTPFYYAVTTRDTAGRENLELIAGENYTVTPFYFGSGEKHVIYHPSKLSASGTGEGIVLNWEYTGNTGVRYFRIIRTRTVPFILDDVRDEWIIAETDIMNGRFTDLNPPSGELYYGIVPYLTGENRGMLLEPGVYVTSRPVAFKKVSMPERIEKKKHFEPEILPAKPKQVIIGSHEELLKILHRTFFKGEYVQAIKELQVFISSTDNDNVKAHARIFIARCLIELHEYQKALAILALPDVVKYYPDESKFWCEYAIRQDR